MGSSLLAIMAVLYAGSFTVDDDGAADFTEIQTAIFSVAPGDVLLVEPGNYAGFVLDKRLTILGRTGGPRPHVAGQVTVTAAAGFTFAGFDVESIRVQDVLGRGRIDDCGVDADIVGGEQLSVEVAGCSQLVVSRTTVKGSTGKSSNAVGGTAVDIAGSSVMLVDCSLTGGQGYDAGFLQGFGGNGGLGLRAAAQSDVVLAGCPYVVGGRGGWGGNPFQSYDGDGGNGLVADHSTVQVRGTPTDWIAGGYGDTVFGGVSGKALTADHATLVVSGVTYTASAVQLTASKLKLPVQAEPYLESGGSDRPETLHTVKLYGPDGVPVLLAGSMAPALLPLGGFNGKLWIDPGAPLVLVVPIQLTGQSLAVTLGMLMPAAALGLEGMIVDLQFACPTIDSTLDPLLHLLGNAAEIIVRF